MKRSDFYIRLTTAALFLAVVCYIGFYVYNAVGTSYETVAAISCTVEETGEAGGFIVREEVVVTGGGSGVSPVARDGEKVASGQVIAVGFGSGDALSRAGELRDVKLRIEQLEAASYAGAAHGAALAADSVMGLSKSLHSGRLYNLDAALIRVESYVMTGASTLITGDLPALRERLAELEARGAGDEVILAPESGVYSQVVDGYEGVGPEMLSGLTPGGLSSLFSAPEGGARGAAGKLIIGIRWYYAAEVTASDTRRLPVGKEIQVRFKGGYQGAATMRVDSVGRVENDKCVVVLSSASGIAEVSGVRYTEAELVFDTFTGIRVPKEAIRLGDNGETFIYLETGAQAERAEVTIITEFDDSYLAVNAGTKNLLREGATIIVKADMLDDGRVVRG